MWLGGFARRRCNGDMMLVYIYIYSSGDAVGFAKAGIMVGSFGREEIAYIILAQYPSILAKCDADFGHRARCNKTRCDARIYAPERRLVMACYCFVKYLRNVNVVRGWCCIIPVGAGDWKGNRWLVYTASIAICVRIIRIGCLNGCRVFMV